VDVVDDAGGDGIATSTVVTGVAPENDGAIHIDLTSEVSLLNAVEILPAPSASLLPVRIVVAQSPTSIAQISSGRPIATSAEDVTACRPIQPSKATWIIRSERIGRFRYIIPAVPLAHYPRQALLS